MKLRLFHFCSTLSISLKNIASYFQEEMGRRRIFLSHNFPTSSNIQSAYFLLTKKNKNVFSRVMEDVVDDFSTLGRVAARLGEWRTSDVDSYQSAYVSLVLHR